MSTMPADGFGTIDYTYDLVVTLCLNQAEASVSIIAQAVPVLRVLIQSWGKPTPRGSSDSPAVSGQNTPGAEGSIARPKNTGAAVDRQDGVLQAGPLDITGADDIELVQLPSGKIVPRDSEEAKNQLGMEGSGMAKKSRNTAQRPAAQRRGPRRVSELERDDVRRVWSALGLSSKVSGTRD